MVVIIDGGMGGELSARGAHDNHGLWSAQALIDAPDLVLEVHRDFIRAGARIIITNSYSTVPSYLGKSHLEGRYFELTTLAGELARQAADLSGEAVVVAGSIPPLSESYRPDMVPPADEAAPIYANLVRALEKSVDVFFCETMSSADEAFNAASAAVEFGNTKPVYVSWTLDETPGAGLRSGEPISAAYQKLSSLPIAGFLFNCTHPEAVEEGIRTLKRLTDKPIGGYANRLNRVREDWTLDNDVVTGLRPDLDVAEFVQAAKRCVDAGATMVGGCCGISPSYIKALSQSLAESSR